MLPLRDRIRIYLRGTPNRTATQIARALDARPSAVNSYVRNMAVLGELEITEGGGPRGGDTYREKAKSASAWERLLGDDLFDDSV